MFGETYGPPVAAQHFAGRGAGTDSSYEFVFCVGQHCLRSWFKTFKSFNRFVGSKGKGGMVPDVPIVPALRAVPLV
jgi:hypothetical protein